MIPILNTMEMYGSVFAYQDDSYTLIEARKTEAFFNQVRPALAIAGCMPNVAKTVCWCSIPVNLGHEGYEVIAEPPLVMKQPLSLFLQLRGEDTISSTSRFVKKISDARQHMFDRLQALRKQGLSLQKSACLVRTAMAGDATFSAMPFL